MISRNILGLMSFWNKNIDIISKNNNFIKVLKMPVIYGTFEKSIVLNNKCYTREQIFNANTDVLPLASVIIDSIQVSTNRIQNKLNLIQKFQSIQQDSSVPDTSSDLDIQKPNIYNYSYNSMPVEIICNTQILCRGISQVCSIIEQIISLFNPMQNIDIYDSPFLKEPTRVPIRMDSISFDQPQFDESYQNIFNILVQTTIFGQIYPKLISEHPIEYIKINTEIESLDGKFIEWTGSEIISSSNEFDIKIFDSKNLTLAFNLSHNSAKPLKPEIKTLLNKNPFEIKTNENLKLIKTI